MSLINNSFDDRMKRNLNVKSEWKMPNVWLSCCLVHTYANILAYTSAYEVTAHCIVLWIEHFFCMKFADKRCCQFIMRHAVIYWFLYIWLSLERNFTHFLSCRTKEYHFLHNFAVLFFVCTFHKKDCVLKYEIQKSNNIEKGIKKRDEDKCLSFRGH